MTRQQLIDKWDGQLAHWQDAAKDEIHLTKEERERACWYAYAISAFLADLKSMDKEGGEK